VLGIVEFGVFTMTTHGSEGMGIQQDANFPFSFSSAINLPGFNLGLAEMLEEADDFLFVMDPQGRVLSFKARNGSGLSLFTPSRLMVRDMMPIRARQKFVQALDQVANGNRFAMFEAMLVLPEKGAAWYEFRLFPTIDHHLVLFIWNINDYKNISSTISNIPFSIEKMIKGWSHALYLRDFETEDHTRRVVTMTMRLAARLGVPEQEMLHLRRGGELHDIGKIAIPDRILLKSGALDEEEWRVMHRHPIIAIDLLTSVPHLGRSLEIPRSHHEKWDGSGYPDGLTGEHIPLSARIFAFADVYDALTSDRPYRRAWSQADALQYISKQSGRHFDPSIMPVFIDMLSGG
jgi:HD-GYP domain-containing protein (c-di-GMP phosphodiesterase class II)